MVAFTGFYRQPKAVQRKVRDECKQRFNHNNGLAHLHKFAEEMILNSTLVLEEEQEDELEQRNVSTRSSEEKFTLLDSQLAE